MDLTRREFTRLSALGLAAQLVPQLRAQSSDRKIGYAIIGLGRIADHFMRGIQQTSNSKVVALVSGHPDKAAKIAEQYGVPKSSIYNYENMDSFRDNHAIDAVYVALPNSMHAEYTIRSAKAGKHVLCEKPMAVNPKEGEAMIDACNAAKVKLMIAYRCHFNSTHIAAIKLLRDGALGQLQQIQSAFGFNCGAGEWRLDKPMAGGGPLMDVGIYCLNATRYLTGEEPAEFSAYTYTDSNDPRFKTVEENLGWVTKFPSGVVATCATTYSAQMDGYFKVYGSKGSLEIGPAFNYDGMHLQARYFDATGKVVELDQLSTEKDPIDFANQAAHFSDCILNNKEPKAPGEEGLRDLKYMREIYHSAGITMS
jgi:predicted dehydrogenase